MTFVCPYEQPVRNEGDSCIPHFGTEIMEILKLDCLWGSHVGGSKKKTGAGASQKRNLRQWKQFATLETTLQERLALRQWWWLRMTLLGGMFSHAQNSLSTSSYLNFLLGICTKTFGLEMRVVTYALSSFSLCSRIEYASPFCSALWTAPLIGLWGWWPILTSWG